MELIQKDNPTRRWCAKHAKLFTGKRCDLCRAESKRMDDYTAHVFGLKLVLDTITS